MEKLSDNEVLVHNQDKRDNKYKLWLDALLDNSLICIMALSAVRGKDGNITDFEYTFINKRAEESVKRSGLTGRRILEEFPGTQPSGLFSYYVEVTETGNPWEGEVFYNYDGYEFWSWVKATKLEDGCLVMYEEITEKKRSQLEVLQTKDEIARRATDKYLSLFNSIDQGFCIIEMIYNENDFPVDYRFLDVNSVFEMQTGLKNAAGKTIRQMVPNHEEHWFKIYGDVAKTGKPTHFENEAAHLIDGVWYDVYAFPVGKPQDRQVGIIFSNITERKKSEEKKSFLLKLIDAIGPLSDPAEIESVIARIVLNYFKADRCYYNEIRGDVSIVRRDASQPNLPSIAGVYSLGSFPIFKLLMDTGIPLVIPDAINTGQLDDEIKKICVLAKILAFVNIPVIKNGTLVGVLSITQCTPRSWTDFEVELAKEIAERTWEVLERGIAESALRESEERFRVLVESTAQAVWEANASGEIVSDSPSWRQFTGQTFEEWLGYGWLNAVHPDDRNMAEQQWKESVSAEKNVNAEYRIRNALGEWKWTNAVSAPIRDVNGEIIKWVGMNYDITPRKLAEQQLKEFYENLEKLVEERTAELRENNKFIEEIAKITPDLITIHDAATNRIVYANHSNIWNGKFSEDQINRHQSAQMFIHPDDQNKAIEFLKQRRLLADGEILEVELKNEFGNNEWGWIRIRSKVFKRDAEGKAQQIISFTSNVTGSKKAEQEIKEKAHFIREITNATPDFLHVYDVENRSIEFLNKDVIKALGYDDNDLADTGNSFFEQLVHPEDRRRRNLHYATLGTLKPNEVRDTEFRVKDKKGKWRWFYARDTYFKGNAEGTAKQALTILQDITEKKEAKAAYLEEKSANDELRRMNEVMDTFVYAAAHDLKAPISNLKLITEVLSFTEDPQSRITLMNRFEPILQTLDKTVTGLVNVLAIEKGVTGEVREIKFQDVVNQLIQELKVKIVSVDPEIKTSFTGCEGITYIESYLFSIFRNMITNALKYSSESRKLILGIQSAREGKYVLLSFKDNGVGIDLETYKNDLFKPFKRFSSLSEGSGIGLHLIKSIVTKNGGKIEVESELDKGTNFNVYLVPYKK